MDLPDLVLCHRMKIREELKDWVFPALGLLWVVGWVVLGPGVEMNVGGFEGVVDTQRSANHLFIVS